MGQQVVRNGSRAVVIAGESRSYSARLYVNCTADSLGDATLIVRRFVTLAGAQTWARAALSTGAP